ncbi:Putative elongator complex protein 1 [Yamadazyma tenuis]|uniref:Elongator complex protein 1 n=1 Tax=Candida tenuis (strain ATCC 10573 / BCRC 21748 / CBS 615 / JCM 9827 / NBRC 10315 / NRRL Y-1498 / VKM Y-70) TaxID=590646 RepID=G3BAD2_CANTC|nr:IkappaB kinase complex, IKAP component [Yamadazyma tenuis ATCC 10573]EGV62034.1 IkappaB kinase complex, IKAP component [Yamadazyma tenuis ATCC 10573]WEJ93279.1 Putative elongator complex protein 1 [Yamadazyma tenuis]
MRNLVILNKGNIVPSSQYYPETGPENVSYKAVFDVVSDSITFALTLINEGIIEIQQYLKTGDVNLLANFPISDPNSSLISFTHFVEMSQLILIYDNGDIISITYDLSNLDPDSSIIEIVGSIDVGLKTASWSPDEETLSLLTQENNLILLSRSFEPIVEKMLNPNDIKISKAKHVSVGWGKAETQFRGKGARALEREKEALKHAGLDLKDDSSQFRDPTVAQIQQGTISEFDNSSCKISWRGDCEFFSVITKEEVIIEDTDEMYARRVIRVFNRDGELDSVSEAIDGLEHNLAWKPQGSLIASTARHITEEGNAQLDVIFYERNGLRRGEFNTRLDSSFESISDIQWSSDSELLAFQLYDRVQLWTTKNYHWYLKQEIFVNQTNEFNTVSFIQFHPEKPLHLMIGTSMEGVSIVDLAYKVSSGPTILGDDIGISLVTDGSQIKLTPFGIANVPPPASFRELDIGSFNINDSAISKNNEYYALSTSSGDVILSYMRVNSLKSKHPKVVSTISRSEFLGPDEFIKQVAFINNSLLGVLVDGVNYSKVIIYDVSNLKNAVFLDAFDFETKVVLIRARSDFNALILESITGSVSQIDESLTITDVVSFPQLCRDLEVVVNATGTLTAFGISANGKLFANDTQVAVGVTSIKVTESHLLFTTAQSKLCFIHLDSATDNYKYDIFNSEFENQLVDERIRQIERGSILVSIIPSTYSVVLQAPRGNLETINPRIMVLSGVRKFIQAKDYKQAFLACRVHRIDLDILYDYDPSLFLNNLESFVKQIEKVDYLDLFVSGLHEEDVTLTKYKDTLKESDNSELMNEFQALQVNGIENHRKVIENKDKNIYNKDSKVNKVCEAVLAVLQKPVYFDKYLQTILTAYACQKPPNLSDSLKLIGTFKSAEQIEQSVIHLCFLSDVNKLYNTALGLYDVKLSLVIAQQSQKDPKEYLPFLQNLHIQPSKRKEFLIDDHLKNYEKALDWLYQLGDKSKSEFDDYVIEHTLYKKALYIYNYENNKERYNETLHMFAQHLRNEKNYAEAGFSFESLGELEEALECYIFSKNWKEALSIATNPSFAEDKLVESCESLSDGLVQDHRYSEAGFIQYNFLNNVNEAMRLYCKHYNYDMAILLAVKEKQPELVESIVDSQLNEGFGSVAELLADFKGQLNSQLRRLRELRAKKAEDPYGFYGIPNEDLDVPDNVSIAPSETSTAPSFFTRYTGKTAGTAKTGASRRSSKNRKREERKKAKGRKGTIYEEEYLIRSVGRLIDRMEQTQPDAIKLIEALIRRNMKEKAYQLQKNWLELVEFLKQNCEEIYKMEERDRERIDDSGEIYLIPEIPVPKINDFPISHTLDY